MGRNINSSNLGASIGGSHDRTGRSPKTINIGETKEQVEYNIKTLNARQSPKGQYETYTNVPDQTGNLGLDQPMKYGSFIEGPDTNSYHLPNDSNVLITSTNFRPSNLYQSQNARDVQYSMNPREGKEPQTMIKFSPNKGEGIQQDKGYDSTQMNNINQEGSMTMGIGMGEKTQKNLPSRETYTHKDIKKLVKLSQYYDPSNTKEGRLYNEQQVSVP